jgi:hypothetical protein
MTKELQPRLKELGLSFLVHSLSFFIPTVGIALGYLRELSAHDASPETHHSLHTVEKEDCTCSCWDGLYKGRHHHPLPTYLFVYFNSEKETLALFFLAYSYFALFQVLLSRALKVALSGKPRLWIIPLLVLSCYSHIYGGWCLFNYLNQEFYLMWRSQIFFCLTEVPITYVLWRLLDREELSDPKAPVSVKTMATILVVFSALHLYLAFNEELLWGFFVTDYPTATVQRDLGLISGDFFSLLYGIYLWKNFVKYDSGPKLQTDILMGCTVFLTLWGFYKLFCTYEYANSMV